jgi:hypothetical protein
MLTEQGPAISFAFEKAEHAVMLRPPRNLVSENLVSAKSLLYSYIVAGVAEAACCLFAYFLVFTTNGIRISELAFSTDRHPFWASSSANLEPLNAARLASDSAYAAALAPHRALPPAWAAAHDGEFVQPPLWVTADGRVYDVPAQWRIYRESQAAWYLTLIMCQFWCVTQAAASRAAHPARSAMHCTVAL